MGKLGLAGRADKTGRRAVGLVGIVGGLAVAVLLAVGLVIMGFRAMVEVLGRVMGLVPVFNVV